MNLLKKPGDEIAFEYRGMRVEASIGFDDERARKRNASKAIAYVDDGPDAWRKIPAPTIEDFPYLAYLDHPTPYTRRGEFTEVDRAWDAHNREIVATKRAVLDRVLKQIVDDASELEIKFSRKAGCACGCSPGFKIRGLSASIMIHVNIKDPDALTIHRATLT